MIQSPFHFNLAPPPNKQAIFLLIHVSNNFSNIIRRVGMAMEEQHTPPKAVRQRGESKEQDEGRARSQLHSAQQTSAGFYSPLKPVLKSVGRLEEAQHILSISEFLPLVVLTQLFFVWPQ
jgi:hypothetical protein